MIALVFLAMTVVAVMAVLLPLAWRRELPQGGEVAVYRDQLAEIEHDRARGTIGAEEAEAARVEVVRRLIAATEHAPPVAAASAQRRRAVAVVALAALPVMAFVVYTALGRPDLPDQPLAERITERQPVAELVARVEAELARHPDDGQGWDIIAPVYLRIDQPQKAEKAYANAIRLLGSTADREAGRAEALILLANGKVTEEAGAALSRALALEPGHPRALFYTARAAEQAGDNAKAADIYRSILADAPPEAAYSGMVREGLARAALRTDAQGPAIDPGALENVSPDERLATIRGMVDGLAARLKESPQDLGGQLRLIRAWAMLGEGDRAKAAASDAQAVFKDDPAAERRIKDLLLGLGLEDKPA